MSRPVFDPVDTSFDAAAHSQRDDVESPSLSNSNALARFEFEPGRSKDGTKVLMVEWEDDDTTRDLKSDWEISWEGRRTVLPAKEQQGNEQPVNRLYFLLGPGVEVPALVNLRRGTVAWKTNPLPAIFSPDLGATAREAGRKGVLHTIWAKKRLQVLQQEIERESQENIESVGLEMATAEKEWIEQNFGIVARPSHITIPSAPQSAAAFSNLNSPSSPRSPGGGRLMDKLKGLRLGTSASELSTASGAPAQNPLSPETSDVAVGSFGSFAALKGVAPPSTLAAKPAQPPQRRIAVQRPPDAFAAQQQAGGMGSLNALAASDVGFSTAPAAAAADDNDCDDLFALPMSPRSPDMAKAPFSFGAQDTMRYLQGGKV